MPKLDSSDAPQSELWLRLLMLYLRTAGWTVLVMLALWWLGVEGIYYHVTPLYALYMPIITRPWVMALVLAAMAGCVIAWKHTFYSKAPVQEPVRVLLIAVGVAALLVYATLVNTASPGPAGWILLRQAVAIAVLAGALFGLTWVLRQWTWPAREPTARQMRWALVAVVVFAFCFPGVIAMLRGGTEGIAQAYMRYETEYINDIGRGMTIRGLFHDYLKIHPFLTLHSKAHPPGPIVILWLWSYLVGRSALALSLATMAMAAAAIVPLYHWVQDMLDRKTAFTAVVLYALMPSIVMFSATSGDIMFTPLAITTLFLFWRALHRNSLRYQLGAGAMYAVLSLTSFTLISLGAFFAFVALLRLRDTGMRRAVVQTAFVMLAAFIGVHLAVRAWSGFDVLACFQTCLAQFQHDQLSLDLQEPRYASWVYRVLNPFTFFIYAGIPASLLFIGRYLHRQTPFRELMWVLFATAFVLNLLYMGRGEGERSALYIFPFIAIPAASYLQALQEQENSAAPLLITAACMGFQCWLMESLLYTYW